MSSEKKIKQNNFFKDSKEQLKVFIEQSIFGIALVQDNVIKYANEAISNLLEIPVDELIGQKLELFYKQVHPDDLAFIVEQAKKKIGAPDIVKQYTPRIISKGGTIKWINLYYKTISYLGKPANFITAVDITEEKKAEQLLKDSEDKYHILFNTSPYAILLVDSKGKIIDFNQNTEKLFGYTRNDLLGKLYFQITGAYSKELLPFLKKREENLLKGLALEPMEMQIKKKDGSMAWINSYSALIRIGEETLYQAIIQDITEKKQAEQRIKESEEKYRYLFDKSPYSIVLSDLKGRILDFNDALEPAFGYKKEEFIGKNFLQFANIPLEDIHLFKNGLKSLSEGKPNSPIDAPFVKKDGTKAWINIRASIIELEKKKYVLSMIQDITKKKESEQKLKESEEKYRDAYNRANFYKDLFAHDINNILQNVLSATELSILNLENLEKLSDVKDMLDLIKEQVNRGAILVSNVQKLSELEDKKITINKVEINDILDKAIRFTTDSYPDKQIEIKIENLKKKYYVKANVFLLDVFENILNNAVQHNNNTTIDITIRFSKELTEGNKFLRIEFLDNGIGIPDERKENIFQRQYNEGKRVSGMGLGLSLVKKVLECYEGRIWVEDKVKGDYSQGSNLILLIPEAV